jgi:hypothetical protein
MILGRIILIIIVVTSLAELFGLESISGVFMLFALLGRRLNDLDLGRSMILSTIFAIS